MTRDVYEPPQQSPIKALYIGRSFKLVKTAMYVNPPKYIPEPPAPAIY